MNIGDKVRLLHGKESGVVTKKLDRGLVEVEIEDGFTIPVLATELVVVSQEEGAAFHPSQERAISTKKQAPIASKSSRKEGFYVAVIPLNDKLHSIYLINQYEKDCLLMVNETNSKSEEKTILSEKLFANAFTKIVERNLDHLNTWPTLTLTILQENSKWSIAPKPEKMRLKIKAKHFQKEAQNIDLLNKKGYLISLQANLAEEVKPNFINVDELKEGMFQQKQEDNQKNSNSSKELTKEIDLHIEAISEEADKIPKDQILSIQMQEFEQKLNQAIMMGIDEVVFIHGVGNGTLKNKIHKYLSKSDNIKFFKDAYKEKFGYGATLVRIN